MKIWPVMRRAAACMFEITFTIGAYPQGWVEDGFTWLGGICTSLLPEGFAQSLIVDGIIAGVGGVVSFVPLILIMTGLSASQGLLAPATTSKAGCPLALLRRRCWTDLAFLADQRR